MYKILVVEDDHFLANAYRVKLSKAGFEVRMASDGIECLDVLKEYTPDVILLDLVMPKMDGFAVLENIKVNSVLSKIPVMVTSNLGQKEDLAKAVALGARDYVVKSDIELDLIVDKLKKLLGV